MQCSQKEETNLDDSFSFEMSKEKVCSKFKDKSHPAVKRANLKAKIELTKARRLFENKLAANIKSDKKSFYEYTRSKSKVMVQMSSVLNKHGQKLSDD